MTSPSQAVELQPHQIDEAGDALARAFFDDPLMLYLFPDEERRARVLPWFMRTGAKYGHRYGRVDTTAGKPEAAAVWLPPGNVIMTPLRLLRTGFMLAPFRFGLGNLPRFMNVMDHLEELHKRDMPPEHWYLMILGVDPSLQGKGVGGTLIAPTLERADRDRLPCYLETMKERNVTFYTKHGFDVVVEDDLPKGGPHFWTMRREPIG